MAIKNNLPIYANAPISGRGANFLASVYSHYDVEDFAESLPVNAQVIDVGAGRSTLGHFICNLRDDVEWANVDIAYHASSLREEVSKNAPSNLSFLPADALDLPDAVGSDQFDRVYSYWMLPHITQESRELGLIAANNLVQVSKPTGKLSVGPCNKKSFSEYGHVIDIDMDASQSPHGEEIAESIVSATELSGVSMLYNFLGHHISSFVNSPRISPEQIHHTKQ